MKIYKFKFQPGDLIEGIDPDKTTAKARIIACDLEPEPFAGPHYRIFWLNNTINAEQFKLYDAPQIETFYKKVGAL